MPFVDRLGRLDIVHGTIVQDVEGEEQRDQHDRKEDDGQFWTGYAHHQDAVGGRGIRTRRPHRRFR